ncbi:hypothetical protein BDF21DRAFT_377949 [Thamnidium elegans]|nr:hypothetical protein BDF21DRAFT_377949 [Thamnidium elegans]
MIIRENLKATKSRIYDLQKQLNFPEYGKDFTKKDEQNIVKKFEITKGNYKCFERTEDIELDEQVRYSENLLFSGTDNGLVTMTETARLDIKQVKFHLKPYNKYSILNDIKGKNVHSSDLQFRSGVKTNFMKLEKSKKQTEAVKAVMNIERSFMDMNIEKAKNINEVDDMMNIKYKHRNDLRKFYYSNAQIKLKRKTEIQRKKCFDKTCSSERQFISSKQNKHPIMLTGDRGYCHGSGIKGHLKYGGVWKPKLHSNLVKEIRGTSAYTNEHCILALKNETHKGRDAISAIEICISGSTMLLLNTQHPAFSYDKYNSENNTDDFRSKAEVFLNRNTSRPVIYDGITRDI